MKEANERTGRGIKVAEDNLALAERATESSHESTSEALKLTRQSLDATRQSAELAKQQLVVVQRAFVHTPGLALEIIGTGEETSARIQVRWANSGATPTKDLFLHVSYDNWLSAVTREYVFPDLNTFGHPTTTPEMIRNVLGPRAEILSARTVIVPNTMMRDVSAGRVHLYIWGWARYRDVFPGTEPHITRACYKVTRFHADGPRWIMSSIYCDQHNCADEECKAGSQHQR